MAFKILFAMDYIREHYVQMKPDGQVKDVFFDTKEGKEMKQMLKQAFSMEDVSGDIQYYTAYAYNRIPDVVKRNPRDASRNVYKVPGVSQVKAFEDGYLDYINQINPDLIIPVGGLALKPLVGKSSLGSFRGVPVQVAVKDQTYWAIPTYSVNYMWVRPSMRRFIEADYRMIGKYITRGEDAFVAEEVAYTTYDNTNFKEVVAVFQEAMRHGQTPEDAVAWDYEANVLNPFVDGARIITLSLSWDERQGVTFPVNHPDKPWKPEEQKVIEGLIKYFLESPIYKVGHNDSFDVRLSKVLISPDLISQRVLDTKVAYYLTISQEKEESFGLKSLAYDFTDLGGYDQPLDDYKTWFLLSGTTSFVKKVEKVRKGMYELVDGDYLDWLTPDERIHSLEIANHLLDKFEKTTSIRNEQDGGNFDYSWIPYSALTRYASGDVDVTRRINRKMYLDLIKGNEKMEVLYTEHYPDLLEALTTMEVNGIQLNEEKLMKFSREFDIEQNRVYEEMREDPIITRIENLKEEQYLEGLEEKGKKPAERDAEKYKMYTKYKDPESRKFKPTAASDLALALYGMTGYTLPVEREFLKDKSFSALKSGEITEDSVTWEDYKTDAKALERIMFDHPEFTLGNQLANYKRIEKLRTTYTRGLLEKADKDAVLHTGFNYTGCLTGDTLVATSNGMVPLSSLSTDRTPGKFTDIGEVYVPVVGSNEPQKANFFYSGRSMGVKLTLANGVVLVATPNHPLMVNNYFKNGKSVNKSNKVFSSHLQDNSWAQAQDIQEGEYVEIPEETNIYGTDVKLYVNEEEFRAQTGIGHSKEITYPDTMTEDLAEWLGMYTADGSYSKSNGSGTMKLTSNRAEVQARFQELTLNLFNLPVRKFTSKDYTLRADSTEVSSIGLLRYLKSNFDIKTSAPEKHIPAKVMSAPKNIQQAFIKGLSLDTSLNKKDYPHVVFGSVNKMMMQELHALLANMGIHGKLRSVNRYISGESPVSNYYFEVWLTYGYSDKYVAEIGFESPDKYADYSSKQRKRGRRDGHLTDGNTHLVQVVKVEEVDDEEFFDLNVPNGASFVANGVYSHNTNTGRLSSSSPNLQQLPKPINNPHLFGYDQSIKSAFGPLKKLGHDAWVNIDFAAQELRVTAVLAQDTPLIKALLNGKDAHTETASMVFGVPEDEVTRDMRNMAKSTTFG